MLDRFVESRVDEVLEGNLLDAQDALRFIEFPQDSPEAAYIYNAARRLSRKASHNTGQIYAQIGIDESPCPANCDFCTLATQNNKKHKGFTPVPDEQILGYARLFDQENVHLICLMATAAYPFEKYLALVQKVRSVISADMPIMANIGDISDEQADELKAAGVQALYHARRLGEGKITCINPQKRLDTMTAAKKAGLQLMTAVEPVHSKSSAQDIVDAMFEVIQFQPYCSGVGSLTAASGTKMQDITSIDTDRTKQLACILRLCAGTIIPFGTGAGNVQWVDAGTNPRGRDLSEKNEIIKRDIAHQRKVLIKDAWDVPERPLKTWFK